MTDGLSLRTDDRGVSELIGFVIVFGIVISSVGVLYMTGFQAMGDYQEHEQTKNAERAMDALAENFNDIVRNDGVKYRASEMSLREGTISYNETGTTIKVDPDRGSPVTASGSFIYEHEGTEIAYEGGAVIRSTDGAGWTIRNPPMRCSSNGAIISLVEIEGDGTTVTAHGSQEITAIQQNTTSETVSGDIELTIVESNREEAWTRTLNESGWDDPDTDGVYECGSGGVIRKTTIEIGYD